jgi:hypothetical protein
MRLLIVFLIGCNISLAANTPITQKEACASFMPAVVRIDVSDGKATGFVVTADGWIVTAAHVVLDPKTGQRLSAILVTLPDGHAQLGNVYIDESSAIRDFALLKIDAHNLPFLKLGSELDVEPGSDITIIGYPFSAEGSYGAPINAKFCMSGTVAAIDSIKYDRVKINAVYFQGPAIKGISGGPIISRDTGTVIGIQSQKLAGIGVGLDNARKQLGAVKAGGLVATMGGVDLNDTFTDIINVLDRHLANGLGTATGASDADDFLRQSIRTQRRQAK